MSLSISPLNGNFVPQAAGARRADEAAAAGRNRGQGSSLPGTKQLTPDEQRRVAELQKIDRAVHAHELAHLAAAGGLATSGASYTYVYGPDGKRYAVGGEVSIDTSAESKPQANIDKGRRIRAAAMAPADPSAQDRAVASAGDRLVALGRQELAAEQRQQRAEAAGKAASAGKIARAYAGAKVSASTGISVYA